MGEIIVAQYGGDAVVSDRDGTRLRTINFSEHQFYQLQDVAVDVEDNIYFTDNWH